LAFRERKREALFLGIPHLRGGKGGFSFLLRRGPRLKEEKAVLVSCVNT